MSLKVSHQFSTLFFFIMSRSIALGMLRQGNTGNDILSILDIILEDQSAEDSNTQPTANPIEF